MTPSHSVALPIPAFIALLLILGLYWIIKGRPRRRGTNPHCRACDYLLIGNVSARCPECGAAITPASIVYGERIVSHSWRLAGLVFLLLGLLLIGGMVADSWNQWYQYAPAYFVMRDFRSGGPFAGAELSELIRRDHAGNLSTKYRNELAQLALAQQSQTIVGPLANQMVDYLYQRMQANDLPAPQKTQFLNQMVKLWLEVRPKIVGGDQVPYVIHHANRTPGGRIWINIHGGPIRLDGNVIDQLSGESGSSGMGGGGSSGSDLPAQSPGKHRLEVTPTVDIYQGAFQDKNHLLIRATPNLTANFEVLPAGSASLVKPISDPTLAAQIQACVVPGPFTYDARNLQSLSGQINITNAPANLAFDVYVRFNGSEHFIESLTYSKGTFPGPWQMGISGSIPTPPATVDLILRGSEPVARRTVDLMDFWNGEIVYPNVPVTVMGAPTTGPL